MHEVGDTLTRDGLRYVYIGYGRWVIDVANSTIVNKDGQSADVIQDQNTDNYELAVALKGHQCTCNSTNIPLGASESFIGTDFQSTLDYGVVTISVNSDADSAEDGLEIQWSNDKSVVDNIDLYTIIANQPKTFTFGPASLYFRIKYTNGIVPQTKFTIVAILRKTYVKPSSHRISDNIVGQDDAELVKSVLTGEGDDAEFHNVRADLDDRLLVNSSPLVYAISRQTVTGSSPLLKFGTRGTVSAGVSSLIWEGANAQYPYLTSAEQLQVYSSTANDTSGGTGIRTLRLFGLDSNFDEITEVVTLNGVTPVTTVNSFIRVFRAYGDTSGTLATNDGTITIANNADTTQLAIINAGDGQTLMATWTVPRNKVAYIIGLTFSTDTNRGASFSLRVRQIDGGTIYPWLVKYRAYIFQGNNNFQFQIPFKVEGKTDIESVVQTPAAAGVTSAGATFELWYEDA